MRLDELASKIEATLIGDGSIEVTAVAPLDRAGAGDISFLGSVKYASQMATTSASAVIVTPKITRHHTPLLQVKEPYYALMQAMVLLHGHRKHPYTGIHPSTHIHPTAQIGENTLIYPGVFIGPRAKIGRDCLIYPNVVIYDDTEIGDRCIIHGNAVVGVDGFGYAQHGGSHHKIPQIGKVIIGNDVEIGSNASIERGALNPTRIGEGTKIDQLVVVGHGSTIGPHCVLVAQVGIAGSVTMGHHVMIGGQAGVAGHLTIGDMVQIAGQSGIMSDVEEKAIVMGTPAMPMTRAKRVYGSFTKLPELLDRIRQLEQRLDAMDESDDGVA